MAAGNLLLWAVCLTTALVQLSCSVASSPSSPLSLQTLKSPETRIINGTAALLANTKHQVSIRNRLDDEDKFGDGYSCGASLISENVVLSAAHCFINGMAHDGSLVSEKDFIVVMGNLNRTEKNNNTLSFDIIQKIPYKNSFNTKTFDDDIVLLILNGSVPSNHPTVQPITLNAGPVEEGTVCQVTGWGVTEKAQLPELLLTVDVPIISNDNCRRETEYGDKILEGMFCAGYMEGGRDACQGDSGGPLVCEGLQVGIVSWGIDCAKPSKPGVYTDIAFYKHWILSKVAEHKLDAPKFLSINSTSGGFNNTTNGTTDGTSGGVNNTTNGTTDGTSGGVNNTTNGTTDGNAPGGSMSTFNGSVFLMVFMTVFGAISSRF